MLVKSSFIIIISFLLVTVFVSSLQSKTVYAGHTCPTMNSYCDGSQNCNDTCDPYGHSCSEECGHCGVPACSSDNGICVLDPQTCGSCSCQTAGCNGLRDCSGTYSISGESCTGHESCNTTPNSDSCGTPAQGGSCDMTNHNSVSCGSGSQCTGVLGDGCGYCQSPICNNNGVQDNGETGIDCGGGGCGACSSSSGSTTPPPANNNPSSPSTKPPTPTISTPSCIPTSYDGSGITISWGNANPAVSYVDISTNNFATFYNKAVSGNSTNASGFSGHSGVSGTLTYNPNTTYYVRLWNGQSPHSDTATFNISTTCSCTVTWYTSSVTANSNYTVHFVETSSNVGWSFGSLYQDNVYINNTYGRKCLLTDPAGSCIIGHTYYGEWGGLNSGSAGTRTLTYKIPMPRSGATFNSTPAVTCTPAATITVCEPRDTCSTTTCHAAQTLDDGSCSTYTCASTIREAESCSTTSCHAAYIYNLGSCNANGTHATATCASTIKTAGSCSTTTCHDSYTYYTGACNTNGTHTTATCASTINSTAPCASHGADYYCNSSLNCVKNGRWTTWSACRDAGGTMVECGGGIQTQTCVVDGGTECTRGSEAIEGTGTLTTPTNRIQTRECNIQACESAWIQTVGDVHSNSGINAPGGPR